MKVSCPVFAVFLCTTVNSFAQTPRDFEKEAAQLIKVLDQNHYKLPVLDNTFSSEVMDGLFNRLDPSHLYFDQKDIQSLEPYRSSLDDEWRGAHWEFLQKVTELFRRALVRGAPNLALELEQPIQWETAESFVPEGTKAGWSIDERAQKNRWTLWVKYQTLSSINEHADSTLGVKGLAYFREREKKAKKEIGVAENRRIKRILENPNGFENYVASAYFRLVAGYYDPHSLYLSPQEFENFKAAVSTKEYSFGLGLNEDQNGNVFIQYLIPGGPAWKSGQLHKGDVLVEFKWKDEVFDLTAIGLDELIDLLDRSDPSSMQLIVSSSNGQQKTVYLKKEKIATEENTVKGFVLNGAKKVGYVSLPGFYTTWDLEDVSSCANDVASEIMKLKGEGITGLILDIRSNGGGSLQEAIEMAGIFIDEGPLMMMEDKTNRVVTLKDVNRGTVYDGPLIILINGQSASASEILASTIQDYHRGVVIGGPSFGKATGQMVFSLDPANPQPSDLKPDQSPSYGYATVTLHRLFRVTGKSNQGIGVTPDIHLADLYDGAMFHELALPHAFRNDSVAKKAYYKPLPALPLPEIKKRSEVRREKEPVFKTIAALQTSIVQEDERSKVAVSLDWKKFLHHDDLSDNLRINPTALYEVSSPEFNRRRIEMDPYLKEFTQQWITNLKSDPYVEEAFQVMSDYIELTSKK